MRVKFTQSTRKHRIGHAHALFVMEKYKPVIEFQDEFTTRHSWIGEDDRGLVLEILALVSDEEILVIHVMPRKFRRRSE